MRRDCTGRTALTTNPTIYQALLAQPYYHLTALTMTAGDLSLLQGPSMTKTFFLVLLAALASLLLLGPPCDASPYSFSSASFSLKPSSSDNEKHLMRVMLGAILPKTSLITKKRQYTKVRNLIHYTNTADTDCTTAPYRFSGIALSKSKELQVQLHELLLHTSCSSG